MKEILRLSHIATSGQPGKRLEDFSVSIFENEIVYFEGNRDSGLDVVKNILTGTQSIQSGRMWINEKQISAYSFRSAMGQGIFCINRLNSLVLGMSIAENLFAVRNHRFFQMVNDRIINDQTRRVLAEYGLQRNPEEQISSLTQDEIIKLQVIKALTLNCQLIILDLGLIELSHTEIVKLMTFLRGIVSQGIAVMILENIPTQIKDFCNRTVYLQEGKNVKAILQHTEYKSSGYEKTEYGGHILGLYDEYANIKDGMDEYRENLRMHRNTRGIAEALDRFYTNGYGKYVVIPELSELYLHNNLDIVDNILLPSMKRVKERCGVIPRSVLRYVKHDFAQEIGISEDITKLDDLTILQRKILSIYRWKYAGIKGLLLINPFIGIDAEELQIFSDYLKIIRNEGMLIIIFSQNLKDLRDIADEILDTRLGNEGKIYMKEDFYLLNK